MWGIVEKLLSNIDEIYQMEKQSLVGEGVADVPESKKKIVYDSLISFKDSLKIICEIIIDDVFSHEETFKPKSMVSSTGATYDGNSTMPVSTSVPYTIRSTNCTSDLLGFINESECTPTHTRSDEMLSEEGEGEGREGSNEGRDGNDKEESSKEKDIYGIGGSENGGMSRSGDDEKWNGGNMGMNFNKMSMIVSESREHSQEIQDLSQDFKIRSSELINQKLASKELSRDQTMEKEKINNKFNNGNSNKIKTYSAIYNKSNKNQDKNKGQSSIQKLDEKTIQKLDEKNRSNTKINTSKFKNKGFLDDCKKPSSPYLKNNQSFSNIELLRKYGKLQTAIKGKHSKPKQFLD